jgi:hypothetical protein
MSIKNKVIVATAVLPLIAAAVALPASTAGAATRSCGPTCIDMFSYHYGTHRHPAYVLDVLRRRARVGQPVILFRANAGDPAQDFTLSLQGRVSDLAAAGLVAANVALRYGGAGCLHFDLRTSTCTKYYPDDYAYEIQYSPFGVDSGLCLGIPATAGRRTPVSLQPCGVSARTVWIVGIANRTARTLFTGYAPLINGAQASSASPYVLTYPPNSDPAVRPRPQLVTATLQPSSHHTVNNRQEWGGNTGIIK